MRQILPLLFIAIGATDAQAQSIHSSLKNTPGSTARAIAQSARSGAKTTAAYWRLAATSDYGFDGTSLELSDSAFYKYSNGRGSTIGVDDIFVDDYGLSSTILYDTAVMLTDNGGGLEPYRRYISNYNSSNQRMEFLEQTDNGGGLKDNSKQLAVRDGSGNITKEINLFWNGLNNNWDTSGITFRVFNSQNKLLSDSIVNHVMGVPNPWSKSEYTYDGSGNMVHSMTYSWNGNGWDTSGQVINTYSNNKIVTSLEQDYDTAGWVNSYTDSTGYDNNGYYNYHLPKYWDVDSAAWINDQLETRINNSKGLPTNVFFSEWNDTTQSWSVQGEGEVSYDNNDNPTTIEVYVYFGGFKLPTPFFVRNMYWEYYFNVGVQDAQKKEAVVIYPNPASTDINIVLGDRREATIKLTGMSGQTVKSMQANTGVQKATLNIAGLPAGNYILSVESEGHAPARQLVTIR